MKQLIRLVLIGGSLLVAACTPLAEGAQSGTQAAGEAKDDVSATMRELFTYNPRPRTPQPASTRYCYRFSSDIVCYDTPQPQLTSKIIGVQGAEGARVVAQPAPYQPVAHIAPVYDNRPMPGAPMDTSGPAAASSQSGSQIQSQSLPPIR